MHFLILILSFLFLISADADESHQVVLITGASKGIGFATAEHLARHGYTVYATAREPAKAQALQKLSKDMPNLFILPLDVTAQETIDKAVATIMERERRIDILINNAGFGIYGPSEMHTIEEMQQVFDANVWGVMRVNHAVVPIMRKQLRGRIINIGSISGAAPSKNMALYSASKAALESLTATDAYHYAKWNIKLSLIQPGPVLTHFEPSTPFGSYFQGRENPYADTILQNRENWKKMMESGQSPYDVAQVIQQAIEAAEPLLWYQTSEYVKEVIGIHFKDLTGLSRIPQIKK